LKTPLIGSEILVFEETASTNEVVEHLQSRGQGRLVVFGESQTRGVDRRGRALASPPEGTVVFGIARPTLPTSAASPHHSAAVAVARQSAELRGGRGASSGPNDVMVNGKKLRHPDGTAGGGRRDSARRSSALGSCELPGGGFPA